MAKKYKNNSETNTENIFRDFYGPNTFIEKSAIPSHYGFKSKNGTSYKGYPDFFLDDNEDFVIIVEAKANDYNAACEEVRFYSENNSINKDIVAIAIAGQDETTYKSGVFLKIREHVYEEIETNGKLLSLKDITKIFRKHKYGDRISDESLKKTLRALNSKFQTEMHIKDTERSLFFSGIMIALKDSTFVSTFQYVQAPTKEEQDAKNCQLLEAHNLNELILSSIEKQISSKINNHSKEYNWRDRFSFIKTIDYSLPEYKKTIRTIQENVFAPFLMEEKQDILGRAYKIFLSKTAEKIENKNIILTPDHIKELMVTLARLNTNDVVLDTCTGSGGFLMEAMEQMITLTRGDSSMIEKIRNQQLIGFEIDPTLFALACSNMFLHGDGRTNLIFGDSMQSKETAVFQSIKGLKPTKCIINPPYENNLPIQFTKQALDYLEPNGMLIIIMPTPTLNRNLGGLTDDILKMARLDFVIKMPNNLFAEQKRTVNTSIFGFTKTRHETSDEVIFYNMDDDGLVSIQHKGRVDKYGKWEGIRQKAIDCIKYRKQVDAEYSIRPIHDGTLVNCYGIRKQSGDGKSLVKFCDLFKFEKGTLASENCEPGEYNFVTASEEWKTHSEYDHETEAIVYAVAAGGSLGRCHYVNGKFIASNLCLILTPKDPKKFPINLQFYSFYLNALRKSIVNEIADGTSKLTLKTNDLEQYYIEYIPIETQNAIAQQYAERVKPIEEQIIREKELLNHEIMKLV